MAPLIAAAIPTILEAVPDIVGWFAGDKTEDAVKDVLDVAKKVTGSDTDEKALEVIKSDPEQARLLKEAIMKDKHVKDQLYLADRQDAREMYTSTDNDAADTIADNIMTWNLPAILGLCIFQIGLLALSTKYFEMDPSISVVIGNVCGYIIKGLLDERLQVCNFFFGSSKSSRDKDQQFNMMKKK